MRGSRHKTTDSYQLFDCYVSPDTAVLDKMLVETALERDETDNFHPKRLRELRGGLILTLIVSAISWAIVFQLARIVFQ